MRCHAYDGCTDWRTWESSAVFSLNWIRNRFIENESNDGSPCGDHIEFCTAHTTWKSQDSPQQSPHHRHSDNALWWHLKDYPFISDRVPHINKLKSHKSKRTSQTFWTGKTANRTFVIDLIFFLQPCNEFYVAAHCQPSPLYSTCKWCFTNPFSRRWITPFLFSKNPGCLTQCAQPYRWPDAFFSFFFIKFKEER